MYVCTCVCSVVCRFAFVCVLKLLAASKNSFVCVLFILIYTRQPRFNSLLFDLRGKAWLDICGGAAEEQRRSHRPQHLRLRLRTDRAPAEMAAAAVPEAAHCCCLSSFSSSSENVATLQCRRPRRLHPPRGAPPFSRTRRAAFGRSRSRGWVLGPRGSAAAPSAAATAATASRTPPRAPPTDSPPRCSARGRTAGVAAKT